MQIPSFCADFYYYKKGPPLLIVGSLMGLKAAPLMRSRALQLCIIVHSTEMHYTILDNTAQQCNQLHFPVLYYTAMHCAAQSCKMHCTALN